jgi:hypothetical protein
MLRNAPIKMINAIDEVMLGFVREQSEGNNTCVSIALSETQILLLISICLSTRHLLTLERTCFMQAVDGVPDEAEQPDGD